MGKGKEEIGPAVWASPTNGASIDLIIRTEGEAFEPETELITYPDLLDYTINLAAGTYYPLTPSTNASFVFIKMPYGNTHAVTLKGVTGDTGIILNPKGWFAMAISPSTTIGLVCASIVTGIQIKWR